ncbi:nucleotidyl transferase [Aurantiacibacter atlanticus]|uniref:Nucleotidyl transferase n=1 Tax=Aurantiacibacter atlanticus TaxID=1648404 RepID=A0A0H4VE22_9SPHN|nr:NTP transferase domain-containing protein [Aurantiacibacter atlanticus]AKQ41344.1 nucleotidyl transferase [Aurantiacibacter atlanticus]
MDGLILAAGEGSRLRALGNSKPLVEVGGCHLIEIAMRQLASAGVNRVIVVTGHDAVTLEARLPLFADRAGVAVESVRLKDWSRPNGYSVVAGATRISGDYLLVMADHILSSAILCQLADCRGNNSGTTLAIDRRVEDELIDPDDATWVRIEQGNHIVAIGKALTQYNAVDCGAFLATPELAPAIKQAIALGKSGSLSDGMQLLADAGRAYIADIAGSWWIDVDDPRAHALAEEYGPTHIPAMRKAALVDEIKGRETPA